MSKSSASSASTSSTSSASSASSASTSSASASYYSEDDVDKMIENKAKYISQTSSDGVTMQPADTIAPGTAPKLSVDTMSTTIDWYFNPNRPAKGQGTSPENHFVACIFEVLAYIDDSECGEVNSEYIKAYMPNASAIVVLRNNRDSGNIIGFACVIFVSNGANRKPHILYIDILCGNNKYSGVGTKLINAVSEYGSQHNIWKIKLSSIEPALGFYVKRGFHCNPCKMVLSIPRPARTKRTRTSRRQRKTVKK